MLTNLARRSRSSLILTTLFAASCAEMGPDASETQDDVASENGFSMNGFSMNGFSSTNGFSMNGLSSNGFSMNGFSMNGFSMNGFSMNGFSMNGFSMNGLQTAGGLSSTSGFMTTSGGREVIKYLVKVAYPAGSSLTAQDNMVPANTYTFDGALGVAPELEFGDAATNTGCDTDCQEKVSAAMLAHVNNTGLHVGIWLVGPDTGIGWGSSPSYPYKEAAYFGNLFAANNMTGYYCAGKDMGSGDAKGRLGSPFADNASVLTSPYGWQWDAATQQNVPQYCSTGANPYCTASHEGYARCADLNGGSAHPSWNHVVTVWRNFESTQLYKICNKASGKCMGVVGGSPASGANVEQRTFDGRAGQTWKILQMSQGVYKIINKTSGMSLDLNGTQVVQKPYSAQAFPIKYITDQPGFLTLKLSSNQANVFWNNWSTSDGGLIQTTTSSSADAATWSIIAVGLDVFDPGATYRLAPQQATNMAVEVCNGGATMNGTCVQQYAWSNGNWQKFFIADAGKGNVKLAMKMAKNKCLGPRANGTTNGTPIEVQDCGAPGATNFNQSWITVQKDNAPGVFIFRNAANPNMCLDMLGNNTNNGSPLQLYNCNGALNQQFAATIAP